MSRERPRRPLSDLSFALLLALGLRVFYSGMGVLLAPSLKLDPGLIRSNDLTENIMLRSAGLAYSLWGVWERFDTLWYVHIAQHGYDRPDAVVFYPLYPLLIRSLSLVLQQPLAAALLISTVGAFFLFWGFQKLLALDLPVEPIRRALLIYAVWPTSFMLFAAYPDSLLTACTLWSVYWMRQERWWRAGTLGLLAGLSKAAGGLVAIPLAAIVWRERNWRAWPASLCLLAPAAVSLMNELAGRPSVAEAYRLYWRTELAFPWETLWASVKDAIGGRVTAAGEGFSADPLLIINLLLLGLIFTPAFIKRIRAEYTFYALGALGLFLMKKGVPLLQSTDRYVLAVFPAFASWGMLLRRRFVLVAVLFVLFVLNLILLLAFFEWSLVV